MQILLSHCMFSCILPIEDIFIEYLISLRTKALHRRLIYSERDVFKIIIQINIPPQHLI